MIKRLAFLLSLAGLLVSAFLAYQYSQPKTVFCPLGGNSCEIVRNSPYSNIFGIPLPFFGIVYYLLEGLILLFLIEKEQVILSKLLLLSSAFGFVFSIYLSFLEAFVIKAYCFWCVISAIIAAIIFFLSMKIFLTKEA